MGNFLSEGHILIHTYATKASWEYLILAFPKVALLNLGGASSFPAAVVVADVARHVAAPERFVVAAADAVVAAVLTTDFA